MEKNTPIFPEFILFPTLDRVAKFIGKIVNHIQIAPDHNSDHYRGAAALLDHQLYDQPQYEQGVLFSDERAN